LYRLIMIAALIGFAAGCTSMKNPLRPVPHVDLSRYMGDWYVIANIPYFAEKNCFDSIESYALRADGKIDNWFQCRKGSFDVPMKRKASRVGQRSPTGRANAAWKVSFFNIISVKYLIIDLDANYQWVVVGHPSRRYGWVMARTPTLDAFTYRRILDNIAAQGYDPAKFKPVPQRQSGYGSGPSGAASSH
jgi:apolipoprotein D and lipocalin family protein